MENKNSENILYAPGQEPENIRRRLETLFKKMDEAYPDKIVISLHRDHKKLGSAVIELYRLLGYTDGNAFLTAYGYIPEMGRSGRCLSDPMEVIEELKRRYAQKPLCKTMDALKAENPDLAPKFKNLYNQANKFFGMPFAKYLVREGILNGQIYEFNTLKELTEELQKRYPVEKPFEGTLLELAESNPDLPIQTLYHLISKECPGFSVMKYLSANGIIKKVKTPEERLNEVIDKLSACCPKKPWQGTFAELITKAGLNAEEVRNLVRTVKYKTAGAYLQEIGILVPKTVTTDFVIKNDVLVEYNGTDRDIVIPEGVTEIGDGVFCRKRKITSVSLPSTLKKIGNAAFQECIALTEITIPDGVEYLGDDALLSCTHMTSIYIPDSVAIFGYGVFRNCRALPSLELPADLSIVGKDMLAGCYALGSITLREGSRELFPMWNGYGPGKSDTEIYLPSTLKQISLPVWEPLYSKIRLYTADKLALDTLLSDENLRAYLVSGGRWGMLSGEQQAKLFLSKQSAPFLSAVFACSVLPRCLADLRLARICASA